jgi:2,3-bisphosphoglycerate-independent phosphoglycerate mutase
MIRPLVLCILDGWGLAPDGPYNSISMAELPNWDHFCKTYPMSKLHASGLHVGLPDGQMGNSEVGHMTIGAGRAIFQELPRIDLSLTCSATWEHPALQKAINDSDCQVVHMIGLVSDGGVHSHIKHMIAYAKFFQDSGKKVLIHAFLDGRDCHPRSAIKYLEQIRGAGLDIGTISGRFYGMDRDKRWDRTESAYKAIFQGKSDRKFICPSAYVQESYDSGVPDEFVVPGVCSEYGGISSDDCILFFNFRSDRVRQLLEASILPGFDIFQQIVIPKHVIGFTDYGSKLRPFYDVLYEKEASQDSLGGIVSAQGLKQVRIAETEKYAHVTFFFNGGREEAYTGESRVLVPSPKVKTYDEYPQMSAEAVTDNAIKALEGRDVSLIVINYANPDMVGHTGNLQATIEALQAVDNCLGRLWDNVKQIDGVMIITADHGNCEEMMGQSGDEHTAHTLNKVPFLYMDETISLTEVDTILRSEGTLADVAPTILGIMKLPIGAKMQGSSLFQTRA